MTLRGQMARGAVWMIGARFAIKSLAIISTLVLVRLLLPADFGLVALATAFVAGLELIKTFGFDGAPVEFEADGLLASAVCHEVDHLDGVLFVDRLSGLRKEKIKRHLRRMSRQQETVG